MPFATDIIELLDNHLREKTLCDDVFVSANWAGIAYDATRRNTADSLEVFPATQNLNGEQFEVTLNDTYPLIVYHKILNKVYKPQGGYGNTNTEQSEIIDCRMVVASYTDRVGLSQENLEQLITSDFADNIARKYFPVNVQRLCFTLKGSILDKQQVWALEYRNIPYDVKPNQILFALTYQIEVDYRKGCLTLSDCQTNSDTYYH